MIATEPRRLRRALTTAVLSLLVVPLGACTVHGTDMIYTPAQGVNERSSQVDVLNAMVVSPEPGVGRLVAGLANNNSEPDALVGVTGIQEDSGVEVELLGGPVELPADGFVQIADIGPEIEGTLILVEGEDVEAGYFTRLLVEFENSEAVEVDVPVVEPGADFGPFSTEGPTPDVPPGADSPEDGEGIER